jgi:hypothetical protein
MLEAEGRVLYVIYFVFCSSTSSCSSSCCFCNTPRLHGVVQTTVNDKDDVGQPPSNRSYYKFCWAQMEPAKRTCVKKRRNRRSL